jgi:hypothetical protein
MHDVQYKAAMDLDPAAKDETTLEHYAAVETLLDDMRNQVRDIEYVSGASMPLQGIPAEYVLMYRAADGQQAYLDPLSVRMLYYDATETDHDPRTPMEYVPNLQGVITCPVLSSEVIVQTEATRRRYKAMNHVPLNTSFTLCFVDLTGVVSRATTELFREIVQERLAKLRHVKRSEAQRCYAQQKQFEQSWLERERQISELWDGRPDDDGSHLDMELEFPTIDGSQVGLTPPPSGAEVPNAWRGRGDTQQLFQSRKEGAGATTTSTGWGLRMRGEAPPPKKEPEVAPTGRLIDRLFAVPMEAPDNDESPPSVAAGDSDKKKKGSGRRGGKTVSLTSGGKDA